MPVVCTEKHMWRVKAFNVYLEVHTKNIREFLYFYIPEYKCASEVLYIFIEMIFKT